MHVPTVLAFGLANFPLIYGLAAASVPVIIHLLNRRKFREVRWAATRFLLAAVQKNSRKIKVEQWLLLAVRTMVIILAVTAMAKPFLEQPRRRPRRGRRDSGRHWVLVLDGSLSMDYRPRRRHRGSSSAKEIARAARQGRPAGRRA